MQKTYGSAYMGCMAIKSTTVIAAKKYNHLKNEFSKDAIRGDKQKIIVQIVDFRAAVTEMYFLL